jgi:hypothetical protein
MLDIPGVVEKMNTFSEKHTNVAYDFLIEKKMP